MADQASVTIRVDLDGLRRLMNQFPSKVVPDGVGIALRNLASRMVLAGREQLKQSYEIRSPWVLTSWTAVAGVDMDGSPVVRRDGSVIRGAVKDFARMWPNPVLTIGHRDPYMELQEVGGLKKTTYDQGDGKNEGYVAIPSRLAWAMRDRFGRLPKSIRHYDLLQRDAARMNETPVAGRAVQLLRASKVKGRKRAAVVALGAMQAQGRITQLVRDFARIVPRAGLFARAQQVADASLEEELIAGLEEAQQYHLDREAKRLSRGPSASAAVGRSLRGLF
ncbi:MAG: hypothetical protein JNL90_12545 [Planctomycetes bacterium]|nr:hypothetical protein [Planctomycetota bacterium]